MATLHPDFNEDEGTELSRLITPSHSESLALGSNLDKKVTTSFSRQLLRTVSMSERQIETKFTSRNFKIILVFLLILLVLLIHDFLKIKNYGLGDGDDSFERTASGEKLIILPFFKHLTGHVDRIFFTRRDLIVDPNSHTNMDTTTLHTALVTDKSVKQTNRNFTNLHKSDGPFVVPKILDEIKKLPAPLTKNQPNYKFKVVVGILSASSNFLFRNATRNTWLKFDRENQNNPQNTYFSYKFLIDNPDKLTLLENDKFRDILFLNSTYSGKAIRLGEKLVIWYNYAVRNYPDYHLIGKADDDVFICTQKMYKFMESFTNPSNIYFGYMHNKDKQPSRKSRMDEMFVFLGWNITRSLVGMRPYCKYGLDCDHDKFLVDTDFGGSSLGIWLNFYVEHYKEIGLKVDVRWGNDFFMHKISKEYGEMSKRDNFLDYQNKKASNFCKKYLLWHKASINDQYYLQKEYEKDMKNGIYDRNPSRKQISPDYKDGKTPKNQLETKLL